MNILAIISYTVSALVVVPLAIIAWPASHPGVRVQKELNATVADKTARTLEAPQLVHGLLDPGEAHKSEAPVQEKAPLQLAGHLEPNSPQIKATPGAAKSITAGSNNASKEGLGVPQLAVEMRLQDLLALEERKDIRIIIEPASPGKWQILNSTERTFLECRSSIELDRETAKLISNRFFPLPHYFEGEDQKLAAVFADLRQWVREHFGAGSAIYFAPSAEIETYFLDKQRRVAEMLGLGAALRTNAVSLRMHGKFISRPRSTLLIQQVVLTDGTTLQFKDYETSF